MKITTWPAVKPGQIVVFRYKSRKDERGHKRTVFCLDPKYRYRKKSTGRVVELFIGLELEKFGKERTLNRIQLKMLLELLSKLEDDILGSRTQQTRMEDIYQDLKIFIKKYPVFKTYFMRECRKRRVFEQKTITDFDRLELKAIVDDVIEYRINRGDL
tara:strand:- start:54 stop:527 length:474 start_codon:yes stop_codon:yes gene_type:complete